MPATTPRDRKRDSQAMAPVSAQVVNVTSSQKPRPDIVAAQATARQVMGDLQTRKGKQIKDVRVSR